MKAIARNKLLAAVLLGSLALNLFLGSWLATRAFAPPQERSREHGPRFDRHAARESLSTEGQEAVDRIWSERRPEMHETLRELRAARRDLMEAFQAQPLDEAGLAATFERMQALSRRSREQLNASIMMIAKSLSAEDRRRYFEAGVKKSRRYLRDRDERPERE